MSYGSSGDPFRRRKRKAKPKPKPKLVDPWGQCDWKELGGLSRDSMVEQGDVRLCIPYPDDEDMWLGSYDSDPLSRGRWMWSRHSYV